MRMNTKNIGDISETMLIAALTKRGYSVSIPIGDNQRYDLIIDDGCVISRVQVKTASYTGDVLRFPTANVPKGDGVRVSYQGVVDAFGVYSPDLDKCYIVPIEDTFGSASTCTMRITPVKKHNRHETRFASDYEI